jgi:hypothetical protein
LWFVDGDEGSFETVWGDDQRRYIYPRLPTHGVGLELRSTSSKKTTEVRKITNKLQRYMQEHKTIQKEVESYVVQAISTDL